MSDTVRFVKASHGFHADTGFVLSTSPTVMTDGFLFMADLSDILSTTLSCLQSHMLCFVQQRVVAVVVVAKTIVKYDR